jgi:hypothetical protein
MRSDMSNFSSMDDSERRRLRKLLPALVLAAQDMDQAGAAARALRDDEFSALQVARVLETGMAVCYLRPFTKGNPVVLSEYEPTEGPDAALHEELHRLRRKRLARTEQGEWFTITLPHSEIEDWASFRDVYDPFPRDRLPAVIDLCDRLGHRMLVDARRVWIDLGKPRSLE